MLNLIRSNNWLDLSQQFVLMVLAFFLPVHSRTVVLCIAVFILLSVVRCIRDGVLRPAKEYRMFPVFYVFYLLGLLFTENMDFGLLEVESRMVFFLLPLAVALPQSKMKLYVRFILYAFLLGLITYLFYCYYSAYQNYLVVDRPNRHLLESTNISGHMHPTYLGMYISAAIMWINFDSFGNHRHWFFKLFAIALSLFFLFYMYKLYSVGPWISFLATLMVVIFAFFYFRKKMIWFFGVAAVVVLAGILAVQNLSLLNSDYRAIKTEVQTYNQNPKAYIEANQNNTASVKARIIVWNVSMGFIADHPFGVGTGDVKDKLIERYREKGMEQYAEKKLNPHNQYLQTAASIGIVSALFLLFAFLFYLRIGFLRKNFYLISLSTLFLVGSFFESLFERQSGIVFFTFFLVIFLVTNRQEQKENKEFS